MMTEEEIGKYMIDNQEKLNQYVAWLDYQIGFSGMGTTALDIKPDFEMPGDIPEEVKAGFISAGKEWAYSKWLSFCEAAKDVDDFAIPENWKCPEIG